MQQIPKISTPAPASPEEPKTALSFAEIAKEAAEKTAEFNRLWKAGNDRSDAAIRAKEHLRVCGSFWFDRGSVGFLRHLQYARKLNRIAHLLSETARNDGTWLERNKIFCLHFLRVMVASTEDVRKIWSARKIREMTLLTSEEMLMRDFYLELLESKDSMQTARKLLPELCAIRVALGRNRILLHSFFLKLAETIYVPSTTELHRAGLLSPGDTCDAAFMALREDWCGPVTDEERAGYFKRFRETAGDDVVALLPGENVPEVPVNPELAGAEGSDRRLSLDEAGREARHEFQLDRGGVVDVRGFPSELEPAHSAATADLEVRITIFSDPRRARALIEQIYGGKVIESMSLMGPSLVMVFSVVTSMSPQHLSWGDLSNELFKADNWKGRFLSEDTLRDYGRRIRRQLVDHGLSRYWAYSSDGVAWKAPR